MPLDQAQRRNALTLLTRLGTVDAAAHITLSEAVRRGLPQSLGAAVEVAQNEGHPMTDVLNEVARDADLSVATELWRLIPTETTALRRTAATALARLTSDDFLPADPARAVAMLMDRAERLLEVGMHGPTLDIAQQAVDRLAKPDHPTPALAALAPELWRVMSRCQMLNGDHNGAVASARLSLRLRKTMCWDAPCLAVASAHGTLATRLTGAGRYTEAREQFEISMTMAEQLLADPMWYVAKPDDGSRINMLILPEDAIEAHALVRAGLATSWGFDPARTVYIQPSKATKIIDVISSDLVNYCQCLDELDDRAAAIEAVERAVALMRDLFDEKPDQHRSHLGIALMLLSEELGRHNRRDESLQAAEEAAFLLRKAALDSGGAFIDEYARALSCLLSATEVANKTVGTMLGRAEELMVLLESSRGTEALLREHLRVSAISQWLDNYARAAERLGDPRTALEIAALVIRGTTLLRGVSPDAEAQLARAVNLRSRLLASLGHSNEAIAAAQEALSYADGTSRLVMLNNLAKRLQDAGNYQEAAKAAEDGVALLDTEFIRNRADDHGAWSLAVSLLTMATTHRDNPPLPRHHVEILREVLVSAPSPPADEVVESNLPVIAMLAFLAQIDESEAQATEILQELAAAESRAGLSFKVRAEYAASAQKLVCLLADNGKTDATVFVYGLLANLAEETRETIPRVEQAKAATEVVQLFINLERYDEARNIAAGAEELLRSEEYLSAREKDLGQKPADFLIVLDQILAL